MRYRDENGQRWPTFETWHRICKLYGWPQTFVGGAADSLLQRMSTQV